MDNGFEFSPLAAAPAASASRKGQLGVHGRVHVQMKQRHAVVVVATKAKITPNPQHRFRRDNVVKGGPLGTVRNRLLLFQRQVPDAHFLVVGFAESLELGWAVGLWLFVPKMEQRDGVSVGLGVVEALPLVLAGHKGPNVNIFNAPSREE